MAEPTPAELAAARSAFIAEHRNDRIDDPTGAWYTVQVAAFAEMDRDQLLKEARDWAWSAQMYAKEFANLKAYYAAQPKIAERRLARLGRLYNIQRKTLKMADFIAAYDDARDGE